MPEYHVRTVHAVEIAATGAIVYDVLLATDFSRGRTVRILMGLRALPACVRHPREMWTRLRRSRAERRVPSFGLLQVFTILEEAPGQEIVLGLTGRFWTLSGALVSTQAATFRGAVPPGLARAAWSFRLVDVQSSRTQLVTETRVRCGDETTRRSFLRYWRVIAPGSGVLRRSMLSTVRRRAEAIGVPRHERA